MDKSIILCDLCDKPATDFDSWWCIASCEEHKDISPVDRQNLHEYKTHKLLRETKNEFK